MARRAVRFFRMMTTTRPAKYFGKILVAALFCTAFAFVGCNRTGNASSSDQSTATPAAEPPELPLDRQTEQKLDPLTKDDVDLYLKVMRAAAERVKAPPPGDTATLDAAKKILATRATGRVPTHDEVLTLQQANLLALSMDQIVAMEMKIDGRTYRGIAEAIEAIVPNPDLGSPPEDAKSSGAGRTLTPIEKRLSDVNAANKQFLAPYDEEIQKLIAVVRNPNNLPK